MDEVIFEEFKGTGNMESPGRALVDRRIFPSIKIERPARAKRTVCITRTNAAASSCSGRALTGVPPVEAMELMLNKLKRRKAHHVPALRGKPQLKLQAPNSKIQRSSKAQAPRQRACDRFGISSLDFSGAWCLGLVFPSLTQSPSIPYQRHPSPWRRGGASKNLFLQ